MSWHYQNYRIVSIYLGALWRQSMLDSVQLQIMFKPLK